MTTFTDTLKNRRSIYHLGRNVSLSNEELTALIKQLKKTQLLSMLNQHAQLFFSETHMKNFGKSLKKHFAH